MSAAAKRAKKTKVAIQALLKEKRPKKPGLLKRLKGTFYSTEENRYLRPLPRTPKAEKSKAKPKPEPDGLTGIARGRKVHKQVEKAIKNRIRGIRSHEPDIHRFVPKFFAAMRAWGLRCVDAEVDVYDRRMKIYTRVDVLAKNADGEYVLIEIKTGYPRFVDSMGYMYGPLSHIEDTHLNRAFLQLLFSKEMFVRTYRKRVAVSYVVQINKDGTNPYTLIPEMFGDYDVLCEYLLEKSPAKTP